MASERMAIAADDGRCAACRIPRGRQSRQNRDECGGDGQSDATTEGGQKCAFHEKLGQNGAVGGA